MGDFSIDDIGRLRWLLLVILCGLVMVYGSAMRKRTLRAFATANLHAVLMPDLSRARQHLKSLLLLGAMTALVAALMGPRYGVYWTEAQQRQLDLMVCLDVSNSMLAEDAGMSRLNRAKDDIKRLLDQLHGEAIGLVVFAGKASLACPLTDDYDFYRLVLEDVGVHSVPLGGTDLGEAIAAAVKGYGDSRREQRAILLLTDGEDHGEKAGEQAIEARRQGIVVYTIGIGDQERGALIPIEKDGRKNYLMYEGQQWWSKMDPTRLKEIAQAGGGEYHPSGQVTATQRTLEWVYSEKLLPMEKAVTEQKRVQQRYARFHWPAAFGLVLLMMETFLSERRRVKVPGKDAAAAEA
jgi:Ca-activated chloride channel family protein